MYYNKNIINIKIILKIRGQQPCYTKIYVEHADLYCVNNKCLYPGYQLGRVSIQCFSLTESGSRALGSTSSKKALSQCASVLFLIIL